MGKEGDSRNVSRLRKNGYSLWYLTDATTLDLPKQKTRSGSSLQFAICLFDLEIVVCAIIIKNFIVSASQ